MTDSPSEPVPAAEQVTPSDPTPLSAQAAAVAAGYAFEGAALELGRVVDDQRPDAVVPVDVRVPLSMLNRHGLIAGARARARPKPSSC